MEQGRFFNKGHAHRAENPKGRNPFGVGTVFQYESKEELADMLASQSLWSRDGFSIMIIYPFPEEINVAIPLEQGRFFNPSKNCSPIWTEVEIPLEQGRFFNIRDYYGAELVMSQSLWSRDGFSIARGSAGNPRPRSQSLCSRDGFSIARCVFLFCF